MYVCSLPFTPLLLHSSSACADAAHKPHIQHGVVRGATNSTGYDRIYIFLLLLLASLWNRPSTHPTQSSGRINFYFVTRILNCKEPFRRWRRDGEKEEDSMRTQGENCASRVVVVVEQLQVHPRHTAEWGKIAFKCHLI